MDTLQPGARAPMGFIPRGSGFAQPTAKSSPRLAGGPRSVQAPIRGPYKLKPAPTAISPTRPHIHAITGHLGELENRVDQLRRHLRRVGQRPFRLSFGKVGRMLVYPFAPQLLFDYGFVCDRFGPLPFRDFIALWQVSDAFMGDAIDTG